MSENRPNPQDELENKDNSVKDSELEEVPVEELETILGDIPDEKKDRIIRYLTMTIRTVFRGPLPPPDVLREYDGIIEDGAERIFSMAEKQSEHRISIEKTAIKEELNQSSKGQWFGFILGLIGLGLATLLAMYDHEVVAGIFGSTTIIGLVTVFVIGKRSQTKDLESKQ